MPFQFCLYGTDGCHLCDLAEKILFDVLLDFPSQTNITRIDIVEHDQFTDQYGDRIPVIQHSDTGNELEWPFTSEELAGFIDRATDNHAK